MVAVSRWDEVPVRRWDEPTIPLVVANASGDVWVVLGAHSIAPPTTVAAKQASTTPERLVEIVEEWKALKRLGVVHPQSPDDVRRFCEEKVDVTWAWLP